VQLTVVHDDFDEGSKAFESISGGWPKVLSSLKSFLETGSGLAPSWSEEDMKKIRELERSMIDLAAFTPKTVYVTYIAATPEKVWQALTDPAFTRQYFGGFVIDLEPRAGGAFRLRYPDGRIHISGAVVEWTPPRRFICTWLVEGMKDFAELPVCLVTYDIETSGDAVKLTMTESHSWDVPDAILAGGRSGWPAILSGLKSVVETGKPLAVQMGPAPGFMDAVKKAVAEKPWFRR
jgi:uncharacterized protein YndB with AHSA1/START domain